MEIKVTNVNQALSECLHWIKVAGVQESSRNGPVIVSPEPVIIIYTCPWERVLFSPERDANPFFHVFEALWMLAGRDDVAWPALFNKRFANYSDDGQTVWGAYGYRWRHKFAYDQLPLLVNDLTKNPTTRRAVLGMWNPCAEYDNVNYHDSDLHKAAEGGKDVPCNTHIYFDRRGKEQALNMTVCNRSNDLFWGALGANVVHFSMLQEYLAAWIGCPIGEYRQFSNNLHVYTDIYPREKWDDYALDAESNDQYINGVIYTQNLVHDVKKFDLEVKDFIECGLHSPDAFDVFAERLTEPFLKNVAAPMFVKWRNRKYELPNLQIDWLLAAEQWVRRRAKL